MSRSGLKDKTFKIIATNHSSHNAIARYEDREQIERMFSCFKSRGFNLEDTHMTNPAKLERLLGVMTISFCWAYKMGDHIDSPSFPPLIFHLFKAGAFDPFRFNKKHQKVIRGMTVPRVG